MATQQPPMAIDFHPALNPEKLKVGIVTAEWNGEITKVLEDGCLDFLKRHIPGDRIVRKNVPGAFELPLGAQFLVKYAHVDAVICLGCLIRGETPHFEYISEMVAQKIGDLNIKFNLPVIFGVLTTENIEQAKERTGGKHGHKGEEAAATALKMLSFKAGFQDKKSSLGYH